MLRWLQSLTLSALCVAQLASAAPFHFLEERTAAGFPAPSVDPFYKAPSNLSSYGNGKVIRFRQVTTRIDANNTYATYQSFYRTNTATGSPDATVATVFLPKNPSTSTKIFAFSTWEDSTQVDCAPSWAFVKNSDSSNTGILQYDASSAIPWALSNGWYVVSSDYLGSQSAFIAGFQEGRALLDGIRATKNGLGLANNAAIVMAGYSGAGHATAWAAELAPSYAPDLNIAGAAIGGAVYDSRNVLKAISGGQYSTYITLSLVGLVGLGQAYSDFGSYIRGAATDLGRNFMQQAGSVCLYTLPSSWSYKNITQLLTNGEAALYTSTANSTLTKESLLTSSSRSVATLPRLIYHGTADQIAVFADSQTYVNQQCAKGANIRYIKYAGADHFQTSDQASNMVGQWITQALTTGAPQVQCGASS